MKNTNLRWPAALLCLGLLHSASILAEESVTTTVTDSEVEPVIETPAESTAETQGGSIDGIYTCDTDVAGAKQQSFLTINGKRDGKSIYLIAAASPSTNAVGGFGMGLVSGNTFSGATSDGKKFSFQLGFASNDADSAYENVTLTGKVGVKTRAGQLVNAEFTCKSLW